MNIEVINSISDTEREVFWFTVFDSRYIVFDKYYLEHKPKGKRKWLTESYWSRLSARDSNINQPILNFGIRNQALTKAQESLRVMTGQEYKAK